MLAVTVVLSRKVKPGNIGDLKSHTKYLVGHRQPVLHAHKTLVRAVLHVAVGAHCAFGNTLGEQNWLAVGVELAVGGNINTIIVGQQQQKLDALDLFWLWTEGIAILGSFEIVH